MHFLSFSIFEQLAFALTTEFALNFSRQGADAPPRLVRLCLYSRGRSR